MRAYSQARGSTLMRDELLKSARIFYAGRPNGE